MSIRFTPGAPQDTDRKIQNWTSELNRASASATGGGSPLKLGDGYEVRHLSVQEIANGKLVDSEASRRWRHLVMDGIHTVGELELDDAQEPMALHEGPGKDGFQAALEAAAQLAGDFEVCVLSAMPLRFVALWLHGDTCDWIMPYPPNATDLTNYLPVSVADALTVLQPMAVEIVKASAGSDPTGG